MNFRKTEVKNLLKRINKLERRLAALFFVFLLAFTLGGQGLNWANAATGPTIITYQGRLLDTSDNPISANDVDIEILFWTAESGGSCLYAWSGSCGTPGYENVTLNDGLFTIYIGDGSGTSNTIPESIFQDNANVYLEITIDPTGDDDTLAPRKQIVSAPYAVNASYLDGYDWSDQLTMTGDPSGTGVGQGSVYINPAAAGEGETLFGVADNGSARFMVDEDGDVTITSESATADAVSITASSLTTGDAMQITASPSGAGSPLHIVRSIEGRYVQFSDGTDDFDLVGYPGSPESNVAADIGSLTLDTANGAVYVKTTDTASTGWTQLATAAGSVQDFDAVYDQSVTAANLTMEIDNGDLIFQPTDDNDDNFIINLAGDNVSPNELADFLIQDNGTTFFTFSDSGELKFDYLGANIDGFNINANNLTSGYAQEIASTGASLNGGGLMYLNYSGGSTNNYDVLLIENNGSGNYLATGTGASNVVINNNEWLGVGDSTPDARLDVELDISNTTTDNYASRFLASSNETLTNALYTQYAIETNAQFTGDRNDLDVEFYGGYFQSQYSPGTASSADTGSVYGVWGQGTMNGSQADVLNWLVGVQGQIDMPNSNASSNVNNAAALYADVNPESAGSIDNAYGLYVDMDGGTSRYGVYVDTGGPGGSVSYYSTLPEDEQHISLYDSDNTVAVGIFAGTGDPNSQTSGAGAGSIFMDEAGSLWVATAGGDASWSEIGLSSNVLWLDGTNGYYSNTEAIIVGADAAFSYGSGAAGDLKVDDEMEVLGDVWFGNADTDNVVFNAEINSDIIPNADDTYDLGSTSKRWQDLYLGPSTLHIGSDGDESQVTYTTASDLLTFQNSADSVTAFQFLDANGGTPILNIDGTNERVGIGTAAPSDLLTVVHGATHSVYLDAVTTDSTTTAGVLDIDVDSSADLNYAISIDYELTDDNSVGANGQGGIMISPTQSSNDGDNLVGLNIADLAGTAGSGYEIGAMIGTGYDFGVMSSSPAYISGVADLGLIGDSERTASLIVGGGSSTYPGDDEIVTGTRILNQASMDPTTGETINVYGSEVLAQYTGSDSDSTVNLVGVYAQAAATAGTGTLNAFGVDAYAQELGGTVNNAYGIRATANTSATINYGVYSTVGGGGTNYSGIFTGGNVGIGTAAPSRILHMQGNEQFTGANDFFDVMVENQHSQSVSGYSIANDAGLGADAEAHMVLLGSTLGTWIGDATLNDRFVLGTDSNLAGLDLNIDNSSGNIRFTVGGLGAANAVGAITATGLGMGVVDPAALFEASDSENTELIRLTDEDNTDEVGFYLGADTPESAVTADTGSLYFDADASGALWVKATGEGTNTGWSQLATTSSIALTWDEVYDEDRNNDDGILDIDAADLEFESTGAYNYIVDLQSTGNFIVQDAGTAFFTFDYEGYLDFNFAGTTETGFDMDTTTITSGTGIDLNINNSGFTGTGLNIVSDDASATGGLIALQQDGTGDSIFIDHNGEATGSQAIHVDQDWTSAIGASHDVVIIDSDYSGTMSAGYTLQGLDVDLALSGNSAFRSGTIRAADFSSTYSGTGWISEITGIRSVANANTTSPVSNMYGTYSQAQVTSGTVNTAYGGYFTSGGGNANIGIFSQANGTGLSQAIYAQANSTNSTAYGIVASSISSAATSVYGADISATGNGGLLYGVNVTVNSNSGANAIYGVRSVVQADTGTGTNYGVYSYMNGAYANDSYGLYIVHNDTGGNAGAAIFIDENQDDVGISIDSESSGSPLIELAPLAALSRGAIALGATMDGDPGSTIEGDMWYDINGASDGQLCFDDGTASPVCLNSSLGSGEWTDTGTILHPNEETVDEIAIGGTTEAGADIFLGVDGTAVFNEQSNDVDFRVESNGNANMFFVDGGDDEIGFGTNAPVSFFHISSPDTGDVMTLSANSVTTGNAFSVNVADLTSGNGIYMYRTDDADTYTGHMISINQANDNTASTGDGLYSSMLGAGDAIEGTKTNPLTSGTSRTIIGTHNSSQTLTGSSFLYGSAGASNFTGDTDDNFVQLQGVQGAATFNGTAGTGEEDVYGTAGYANMSATGESINISAGAFGRSSASNGTISSAYGVFGEVYPYSSGAITNGYGVYGSAREVSDALTNGYGGYFVSTDATTNYGIYASAADYAGIFTGGGNVGIGDTTPSHDLVVSSNSAGESLLYLDAGASVNQNVAHIENAGTGIGLRVSNSNSSGSYGAYITQAANSSALLIQSDATTQASIDVSAEMTSGQVISVVNAPAAASTSYGIHVNFSGDSDNDGQPIYISPEAGSGVGQIHLGTGQNSASSAAESDLWYDDDDERLCFETDTEGTICLDENTGGGSFSNINEVYDESVTDGVYTAAIDQASGWIFQGSGSLAGYALEVGNTNNTGSLLVDNDGNGKALDIDQSGNARALEITSTNAFPSAASNAVYIKQDNYSGSNPADNGVFFLNKTNSNGLGMTLYTNASSGTGRLLMLKGDHASYTGDLMEIENDGTGNALLIDQNGDGAGLNIDHDTVDASALLVDTLMTTSSSQTVGIDLTHANSTNATSASLELRGTDLNTIYSGSKAGYDVGLSGARIQGLYRPSASSVNNGDIYGVYSYATLSTQNSADNLSTATAVRASTNLTDDGGTGGGAIADAYGIYTEVLGDTGTIANARAMYANVQSSSTISNAYGAVLDLDSGTNKTGLQIDLGEDSSGTTEKFMEFVTDNDTVEFYAGTTPPSFAAEGGSLYFLDDGNGAQSSGLYLNVLAASDTGNGWTQISTGGGSDTLDDAYNNFAGNQEEIALDGNSTSHNNGVRWYLPNGSGNVSSTAFLVDNLDTTNDQDTLAVTNSTSGDTLVLTHTDSAGGSGLLVDAAYVWGTGGSTSMNSDISVVDLDADLNGTGVSGDYTGVAMDVSLTAGIDDGGSYLAKMIGGRFVALSDEGGPNPLDELYGIYTRAGSNGASANTANVYGIYAETVEISSGTNVNGYGGYFASASATNNYGLYATATSGVNNYAGVFDAGDVGIGDTTPDYKLDVEDTIGMASLVGGEYGAHITTNSDTATVGTNAQFGGLKIDTEGTYTTGSGVDVIRGIFNTTDWNGTSSGTGMNEVYGIYNYAQAQTNTDDVSASFNWAINQAGATTGDIYGGEFYAENYGSATNAYGIYASATGATNNYAAIFDNGNVGIGDTTPDDKFDIVDTISMASVTGEKVTAYIDSDASSGTAGTNAQYHGLRVDATGSYTTGSGVDLIRGFYLHTLWDGTAGGNGMEEVYGIYNYAQAQTNTNDLSASFNWAVNQSGVTTGDIYGGEFYAEDYGTGTNAYAVFASASGATNNYALYSGDGYNYMEDGLRIGSDADSIVSNNALHISESYTNEASHSGVSSSVTATYTTSINSPIYGLQSQMSIGGITASYSDDKAYSVMGQVTRNGGSGTFEKMYGGYFRSTGILSAVVTEAWGVFGDAAVGDTNYGVFGTSTTSNGTNNYGVYGQASSGSGENFALYAAEGLVQIEGDTTPTTLSAARQYATGSGDLFVLYDIENNGNLYTAGDIHVGEGIADGDSWVYFFDGSSDTGQNFGWDDSPGQFHFSDRINVSANVNSGFAAYFFNDGNNTTRHGIGIQSGEDTESGTNYYLRAYDGNAGETGGLRSVSGTFAVYDTSDARLKTNIVDANINGLEIIDSIQVRDFNWADNPDGSINRGFIAQELMEVYPEMVVYDETDDLYTISKSYLIPVLVKAVQEVSDDVLGDDGVFKTLEQEMVLTALDKATESISEHDSNNLTFRGSVWNGSDAEDVEMKLTNTVTDTTDYRLSVTNTADAEVAYVNSDGDLAISGRLYPSDRGTLQENKYIYYDGSAGLGGDMMRTNASGWATGSYDFAEMFPSDQYLEAGEVVTIDPANQEHVKRAIAPYDDMVVGVISTKPGFLAGDNNPNEYPVALAGRVPVLVSTENGAIAAGDPLTSSNTTGVAMKATEPGRIIGYALDEFDQSGIGTVIMFVEAGWWGGTTEVAEGGSGSGGGSVGGDATLDSLSMYGDIAMLGNNIIGIARLAGISDRWSVDEEGAFNTEGGYTVTIESHQGEDVEAHAVLSPEHKITLAGTGQLSNGQANVEFNETNQDFNGIISTVEDYRVLITLTEEANGVYVTDKTNSGFKVLELNGGNSSATFDWYVEAYRKDYEPSAAVCGNLVIEEGEECDDGNAIDGDGCSAACLNEVVAECGNGAVEGDEECDDGNIEDGDGCSAVCLMEEIPVEPVCGDGVVEGDEECDDGNTEDGDGCSAMCTEELPPEPEPVCGDGTIEGTEECDDGNTEDGDGCSAMCVVEAPPEPEPQPEPEPEPVCGDGVTEGTEECDDGNTEDGDGCSAMCVIE